ncbi:MAG TPA: glycoside hydrolase family 2 TIM barrel-domain containing protein [Thermomicrobiales bacterium]|nr:glycoside hydrolase family 2 TIM barrel-domain containing protein [Thermomicrobiales bacterium]
MILKTLRDYDGDAPLTAVSRNHPRPQLQRATWESLNGRWDFALDEDGSWSLPEEVAWDRSIVVPFAPETPLSGIGVEGFFRSCWYRRTVEIPPAKGEERVFLMFGAVDHSARVWVDGSYAGCHEGGYTPFSIDITDFLRKGDEHEIILCAEDDPHDLAKPRGKQDWQLEPHAIWYPRTTGIWQTVWLDRRPASWIDSLLWKPSLAAWDIGCEVVVEGESRDDLRLEVILTVPSDESGQPERLLAHDVYSVVSGEVHRRIALSDPGIDDFRNELLWSPSSPTLIDATLRLLGPDGEVIDEVLSYTALRAVGVEGDRFVLNGRALKLRLVLDQGYWPESGLTAPDDDALRRDVELAKAMGFNGVRKHQKIEDPRYLYWADHLGLLVWEEMPSAYRFTLVSIDRLVREWTSALLRDMSHPCVVTWVPFNESWGVPDLPSLPPQQSFIQSLYHLTKALDPTRPVVGNDGWESAETDIIGIHDYDDDPARIHQRYWGHEDVPTILRRVRPGGRITTLDGHEHTGQPVVLTEFGGIAYAPQEDDDESWGYSVVKTPADLQRAYSTLMETVRDLPLLAGFCYTQFADTYQEKNGLLYADRTPKFPIERIAEATEGPELQRLTAASQRRRKPFKTSVAKAKMTMSGDGKKDR